VYEYWIALKGDRMMPTWKDVDLCDLPLHLISTTLVIDIGTPIAESIYRFWGSKMTTIHGRDMTADCPYNIEPKDMGQQLYEDHCAIAEKKSATAGHYSFFASGGYVHSHSLVRLPLSDDGENVTQILIVIDYSPKALSLIHDDREKFNAIARQSFDRG